MGRGRQGGQWGLVGQSAPPLRVFQIHHLLHLFRHLRVAREAPGVQAALEHRLGPGENMCSVIGVHWHSMRDLLVDQVRQAAQQHRDLQVLPTEQFHMYILGFQWQSDAYRWSGLSSSPSLSGVTV